MWRATDVGHAVDDVRLDQHYKMLRAGGEAAQIMKVARRVGLPYSEVLERWTRTDLAMERAWDLIEFEDQMKRCPRCHVDPEEVVDDRGRELDEGAIQIEVGDCVVCGEISKVEGAWDEEDRRIGKFTRLRPRPPGEPFVSE